MIELPKEIEERLDRLAKSMDKLPSENRVNAMKGIMKDAISFYAKQADAEAQLAPLMIGIVVLGTAILILLVTGKV